MRITFSITIILLSIAQVSFAQSKVINKGSVERVLGALAADDKLGRPSMRPEVMERSIVFIEGEFKRIGLSPLDGLKSFRQEFTQDAVHLEAVEVRANTRAVPPRDIVVVSLNESINWTNANVNRIKRSDNALQTFRSFLQDTTNTVVIVDTAHAQIFRMLQSRFSQKRIVTNQNTSSKIFVLCADTAVNNVSVKLTQKREKIVMTNVVGQIKAKKATTEKIIFSGHYDHLGTVQPVDGDSIANGADDDASGTTAVILLADHFKRQKGLTRDLIFVAFTAEEIGGYGSRYFSSQLNPSELIAMFNIEMIGKQSKWGVNAAFITGFERSDFGQILQQNLTGSKFSFYPDPYPAQNLFNRSDNATLARLGVPAHTISTDQIDSDQLYHTVNDEFDSIDTQNMANVIQAIALSANSLVRGTAKPTRIDTTKVH